MSRSRESSTFVLLYAAAALLLVLAFPFAAPIALGAVALSVLGYRRDEDGRRQRVYRVAGSISLIALALGLIMLSGFQVGTDISPTTAVPGG